jgi:alkylhydroperoxidase family enzyme
VGRASGVTEAQIADLARFEGSPAFTDLERLVLRYAVEMTRTPVEVPNALFAELRARFSEAQIVELTAAIAWENYRARFDHALGVEAQGFSDGAACVLPERPRPGAA